MLHSTFGRMGLTISNERLIRLYHMPKTLSDNTLERVLTAAESLFAEQGYNGASLRQITKRAAVNLASVNYHYGDKESLYIAVIKRRLQPINLIRLAQLQAAEYQAGTQPVPLSLIIEIMARPIFELGADVTNGGN